MHLIYIKETFVYLFFKAQTDSCAGLMHKRAKATQICAACLLFKVTRKKRVL